MLRSHPRLRATLAVALAILAMPIVLIVLLTNLSQERR